MANENTEILQKLLKYTDNKIRACNYLLNNSDLSEKQRDNITRTKEFWEKIKKILTEITSVR